MIREIDETFESNNSELLETVYLPAKDIGNIKDSKAFKILSDNITIYWCICFVYSESTRRKRWIKK